MALETLHNVQKGVYQLLNAPSDVEGGTPVSDYDGSAADAHEDLRKLFSAYRNGYRFFYPHAERWWKGCVAAELTEKRTRYEALQAAFERRLAGPASAPEFVWFIRYFWLRCDGINKKLPLEHRVAPEVVLLKWLVDAGDQDYVTLITCMPYWPMGLDEQGEWC
jgi:hypothetical protein